MSTTYCLFIIQSTIIISKNKGCNIYYLNWSFLSCNNIVCIICISGSNGNRTSCYMNQSTQADIYRFINSNNSQQVFWLPIGYIFKIVGKKQALTNHKPIVSCLIHCKIWGISKASRLTVAAVIKVEVTKDEALTSGLIHNLWRKCFKCQN